MERHRSADWIVYDCDHGMPKEAIYRNPIWQSYVEAPREFFSAIARLSDEVPAFDEGHSDDT